METAEEEIVETILEEAGRECVSVCLSVGSGVKQKQSTVVTLSRYLSKQRYTATPSVHKHTHFLSLSLWLCMIVIYKPPAAGPPTSTCSDLGDRPARLASPRRRPPVIQ